jgi:hypothetical protein
LGNQAAFFCCDPNGKFAIAQMPNDAAAEKARSAEHGDGARLVGAVPEAESAIAPSNSSSVVLNCMIAPRMTGCFEPLLAGSREQRSSETEFVAIGVN